MAEEHKFRLGSEWAPLAKLLWLSFVSAQKNSSRLTGNTPQDFHALYPDAGPALKAAIDYGLDPTLIEHNLRLTPAQRLRQHQHSLKLLRFRIKQ